MENKNQFACAKLYYTVYLQASMLGKRTISNKINGGQTWFICYD